MDTARLIEDFIASRTGPQWSPHTTNHYRWILPKLGSFAPDILTRPGIEAWLRTAPSAETARTWLRAARAFSAWAETEHGVENAARRVKPPRGRPQLPRVFTTAELRRILAHAREASARDYAAMLTLADTGIRIGECANMRTQDLELAFLPEPTPAVVVTGKTGQRRVSLSPETHAALLAVAPPAGPIFRTLRGGSPMTTASLRFRVFDLIRQAGISGPKLGPHTFRHTFATHYLRDGGDLATLSRLLGHSNIRTTSVYLHLADHDALRQQRRHSPLAALGA